MTPVLSKALEPLSPCCPTSQSSFQWRRSSIEKKSATLSGLEASLEAAEQPSRNLSQRSSALVLGTHSDPATVVYLERILKAHNALFRNVLPETPLAIRKCMENPELFKVQLPISDDEDESDKERRAPGSRVACSCCDSDFFENAAPSPPLPDPSYPTHQAKQCLSQTFLSRKE
ncbi:hypothetical protein MRX96_009065 [Rhipicephalus microplus]